MFFGVWKATIVENYVLDDFHILYLSVPSKPLLMMPKRSSSNNDYYPVNEWYQQKYSGLPNVWENHIQRNATVIGPSRNRKTGWAEGLLGCGLTCKIFLEYSIRKRNKNITNSCILRNIQLNILPISISWVIKQFLEYSWNILHVRPVVEGTFPVWVTARNQLSKTE